MILFLAQESSWNQRLAEVVSSLSISSTIVIEHKSCWLQNKWLSSKLPSLYFLKNKNNSFGEEKRPENS